MFNRGEGRRGGLAPADKQPAVPVNAIDWRRLLAFLNPYRGRMALALVALAVSSALGLAFPLVIVRLLDSVTTANSDTPLNTLAIALLGLFLVQAAFASLQSYLLAYVGDSIVYDLRTSLYNRLQQLSLDFYSSRRVGDIVSRLSSDVTQMRSMLTSNLTTFLSQSLSLVGSIIIVLSLNASLTLFILALIPVIVVAAGFFGKRVQGISTTVQDNLALATVVAEEGLQGIRVVKSFGREPYETGRYGDAMFKTFRASLKLAVYHSLFTALMMFLGFGSIAAIMWYGGREVLAGRLSVAMISGFLIYGIAIAASLGGLAGLYGQFRAALGGVQRVFELLDAKPSVQDAPDAVALPAVEGRLSFEDVSFQYTSGTPVLEHVSLDVMAGEIIALVGPSGAGKSTIVNLIPRFYDPSGGSIRIDGHNLRHVSQQSLRAQIGIVPQETLLFGGTVRENILYGRLDASEAEMIAAACAANAHDFIMALPKGYDTVVGERGMNLSGGQRQRVAIARAILKDPAILLLDEATSSLDNESEELVQEALDRLMQNRTTLIVAHRLSTIKVAHRIVVLEEGHIAELGTHAELLARNGLYAKLYSMQFRNPDEEIPVSPLQRKNGHNPAPVLEPAARPGLFGFALGGD